MTGTRGRRAAVATAAVAASVLLAGCASTVSGTATALATAPPTAESAGEPTVPTTPSGPPADVTPSPEPGVGTLLESHRIASVTSLVQTTFPARTDTCFPSGPWSDPGALDAAYFGSGSAHLASVDVLGLGASGDVAATDRLLPAQRDLVDA